MRKYHIKIVSMIFLSLFSLWVDTKLLYPLMRYGSMTLWHKYCNKDFQSMPDVSDKYYSIVAIASDVKQQSNNCYLDYSWYLKFVFNVVGLSYLQKLIII